MTTPKRRSLLSFIFTCLRLSDCQILLPSHFQQLPPPPPPQNVFLLMFFRLFFIFGKKCPPPPPPPPTKTIQKLHTLWGCYFLFSICSGPFLHHLCHFPDVAISLHLYLRYRQLSGETSVNQLRLRTLHGDESFEVDKNSSTPSLDTKPSPPLVIEADSEPRSSSAPVRINRRTR